MTEDLVLYLRKFRKVHRVLGIVIAILLLISAVTGILLALKKEFAFLQPPTQKGGSELLSDWLPVDDLANKALAHLHDNIENSESINIDRIDIRPSKGVAKVIFDEGSWEIQIDGVSAEILSIGKRHSDWIEHLHDGSIISDGFKLVSMNFLGFGAILLIISGTWLYYGPGIYRRRKRAKRYD